MTPYYLHPRLTPAAARARWEIVRELSPASARERAIEIEPPDVTWTPTGAPRISRDQLDGLRAELVTAVAHLPFPEPLTTAQREDVDRRVMRVYVDHGFLFPAEASQAEIWSYHALALAPDLCLWRWQHMASPNIERFVGIDLTRHSFGRLWWRAYTFTGGDWSDTEGFELLAALNEADVDHLQARRTAYGVDPPVVRALATVYLDVRARAAATGVSSRVIWRDLLPRVLRRGAFVHFGALDPQSLVASARTLLEDSIAALQALEGEYEESAIVEEPDAMSWSSFDEVPLARIVVALTNAVEAEGSIADLEIPDAVGRQLGVAVPGRFKQSMPGFAFMASVMGYVVRDNDKSSWRLGQTAPAPDGRWGNWTVETIRRAAENVENVDDDFMGSVFNGRLGKTVRRTIRAAAQPSRAGAPIA